MIEYSQEEWVNYFIPKFSAAMLATLFCKDYKTVSPIVEHFLQNYRNITPDNIKYFKDKCDRMWSEIIQTGYSSDLQLSEILSIEGLNDYTLNLIHSLTRIPEWFMYTEEYLNNNYSPDMINHLEDINALAIDRSIYPYNVDIPLSNDIITDFYNQEKFVLDFIHREGIDDPIVSRKCTRSSIESALKTVENWVVNLHADVPDYAKPWVYMMREIRMNIRKLNKELDRVMTTGFEVSDLTLSESICYLNDDKLFRDIMTNVLLWQGKDGKGKISALIGNIFHMYYKGVPIPMISGQINMYNQNMDMLFSRSAPGLGPAYKIRIVFSTSSEIQNISEICARFLRHYHKSCYHHAYLAQTEYILANAKFFKDVQCTDCTGYSDYLNRNVYRWLMRLMGMKSNHVDMMMNILSMPVKVGDKVIPVPFGSLQGIKFLVYIMNDANALIGLIQNQLRVNKWTDRQNAGDDVYAASRDYSFSQTDLSIDIAVWLWFNCPTNMSKSAWLKRDGYWDFCKVYFSYGGRAVTGLPPKMYNKEVLNIRDIAEIYKNFDRTGVQPLRSIEEFTSVLEPLLMSQWKEGMKLYNPISDLGLRDKIDVAKQISYKIGGLSSNEPTDTERINHLIEYCYKLFAEYDLVVGDIYTWALQQGFEGRIGEFLLQVKVARAGDFINYLKRIEDILESYQEGYVCIDDVDELEDDLESMTRIFLDSGKVSASGSTYHRLTPKRSGDTTLIRHRNFIEEGLEPPYKMPKSVFDAIALAKIAANTEKDNITRLNEYAVVASLYQKYSDEGLIEWGGGGYNQNFGTRAYIRDNSGKRYRLYCVSDDCYRNDIVPRSECRDPHIGLFIDLCKRYDLVEGTFRAESLAKRIAGEMAEQMMKEIAEHQISYIRTVKGSREDIKIDAEDSRRAAERVISKYKKDLQL